ncbi:MAG: aminotransferase class I/II-fold pyridoxal phosphate-dependent enzyme [Victivallaceae bacterium]|nr:8-amino-7-oxononanoate synthase [Victivallaceae bacterium]
MNPRYQQELEELSKRGNLRSLRATRVLPGGRAEYEGRVYLNFSGNDYLGVAADPELRAAFFERYRHDLPLLASTGSRLLGGDAPEHELLESELAKLYGRPVLAFNSGYHANVGILPALTCRNSTVFSDKLNHASIIDGLRLCEGEFKRYPHLDYDRLEEWLAAATADGRECFIVSESVFSMDGDFADLVKLVELKKKYNAMLVVDEAHAAGVTGGGRGLAAQLDVADGVDVLVGTLGKAFGSMGSYAVVGETLRDYLVNTMRPFIFSTALPPMTALWSAFVIEHCGEFESRRQYLAKLCDEVRAKVAASGYRTLGESQIVPAVAGENAAALALAEKCRSAGLLVFAVRPPTVPVGTARLRFSLSAAHPEETPDLIGKALR